MAATVYVSGRLGELYTAALAGLTLARTGNAVPTRTYHSHGPPAVDFCEEDMLAVYLDNPAVGEDGPSVRIAENTGPVKRMPILRMCVELWRCVPTVDELGNPPTAAALLASADGLANDMWALDTYLRANAATLFPTGMAGTVVPNFSDPVPLPPHGKMAGWRWRVQVPVSDAGP